MLKLVRLLKVYVRISEFLILIRSFIYSIAFNTKNFIENTNTGSKNQSDLTKKLKDLILTSSSTKSTIATTTTFDSFIKYYLKLAKVAHVEQNDRSKIKNFSLLTITFFQYLFNLFKVSLISNTFTK